MGARPHWFELNVREAVRRVVARRQQPALQARLRGPLSGAAFVVVKLVIVDEAADRVRAKVSCDYGKTWGWHVIGRDELVGAAR